MASDLTRREFLRTAAKTTAGLGTLNGITFFAHPERVLGANDRVRVAVCGLYGRGKDHLSPFSHLSTMEIDARFGVAEKRLRRSPRPVARETQWHVYGRQLPS